jgi:hypothetical protein
MNCYGPIPEEWDQRIQRILEEIYLNWGRTTLIIRDCVDLLKETSRKRMEDMRWVMTLRLRLHELEVVLENTGENWTQQALRRTRDFIRELEGN